MMTDQTIIDDAKAAGAAIFDKGETIVVHGKYGSGDAKEFLTKFAQLRDARAKSGVGGDIVNHCVNRFLGWKLPHNFFPDARLAPHAL